MRLLICAGGTGGGVYPALAVLDRLIDEYPDTQILWVGIEGGMEADLVARAGISFDTIPAAGVHGVGLRRLPRNIFQIIRGFYAARRVVKHFRPDIMFFTGGYVAPPMALAGLQVPKVLYVPDIEPGLALKFLARFADWIALTTNDSRQYFSAKKDVVVSGYPIRSGLSWNKEDAFRAFGFTSDIPTLLVTGGSLGSLSINKALVAALPELLEKMQIIHITGQLTWPQFEKVADSLRPEQTVRYQSYPYLHKKMGAAFTIADLVISRAGASTIGEYPYFGIPAILVPYPHAWRYQKVNANYLVRQGAAVILEDEKIMTELPGTINDLMNNPDELEKMKIAMRSLSRGDAALSIAKLLRDKAIQMVN